MRRDEHRTVFVIIRQDRAQNKLARRRIDARDRLIEQIEPRAARHDEHELHLFARALRERFDPAARFQTEHAAHFLRLGAVKVGIEVREHIDHIADTHPVGEISPVGQIARDRLRLYAGQETRNARLTRRRLKKAVEDLNKRRLARAVRAEQTDDLAGCKAQINAAQRLHRFKAPAQPGAFYQFFIHRSFSFPPAPYPRPHRGNSPALPFP